MEEPTDQPDGCSSARWRAPSRRTAATKASASPVRSSAKRSARRSWARDCARRSGVAASHTRPRRARSTAGARSPAGRRAEAPSGEHLCRHNPAESTAASSASPPQVPMHVMPQLVGDHDGDLVVRPVPQNSDETSTRRERPRPATSAVARAPLRHATPRCPRRARLSGGRFRGGRTSATAAHGRGSPRAAGARPQRAQQRRAPRKGPCAKPPEPAQEPRADGDNRRQRQRRREPKPGEPPVAARIARRRPLSKRRSTRARNTAPRAPRRLPRARRRTTNAATRRRLEHGREPGRTAEAPSVSRRDAGENASRPSNATPATTSAMRARRGRR